MFLTIKKITFSIKISLSFSFIGSYKESEKYLHFYQLTNFKSEKDNKFSKKSNIVQKANFKNLTKCKQNKQFSNIL